MVKIMVDKSIKEKLMAKINDNSFGPADLLEYLGVFVDVANESDDIREEADGWDRVLQFKINGIEDFYLTVSDGTFNITKGSTPNPDVTLTMGDKTAAGIFTGEVDATSAYMSGDLKVQGPLPDAVKFRTITEMVREEIED
jgi:putative sterol carrier protein